MTFENSTSSLSLHTAGLNIRVDFTSEDPAFVETLASLWRDSIVPLVEEPDIRIACVLPGEGTTTQNKSITIDPGSASATYEFSGAVTQRILEHLVGEKLLFHAGAVDLPTLGVVMTTGASGAGKSTSITTLGQIGAYITDELCVVDPHDFTISAFAKPISRVESTEPRRIKKDVSPSELGINSVIASEAPGPAYLILVNRDPEVHTPRLEELGLIDAMVLLASQSSSIWKFDRPLQLLARFLGSLRGFWKATYAEASTLYEALEAAACAPKRAFDEAEFLLPHETPNAAHPGQYAVEDFHEAAWCNDEVLVLLNRPAPAGVRVSGIGALAWRILHEDGPLNFDELLSRVIESAGHHDEASELLQSALDKVVEQGAVIFKAA